jgi:hypothetical protein
MLQEVLPTTLEESNHPKATGLQIKKSGCKKQEFINSQWNDKKIL